MLKFQAVVEKTAKKTLGGYFFAAPCMPWASSVSWCLAVGLRNGDRCRPMGLIGAYRAT